MDFVSCFVFFCAILGYEINGIAKIQGCEEKESVKNNKGKLAETYRSSRRFAKIARSRDAGNSRDGDMGMVSERFVFWYELNRWFRITRGI